MFKSYVIYQKNIKYLFNFLNIINPKLVINSYVNTPQLLMDIFYNNKLNVINRLLYLVNEEENNLYLIVRKKYNFDIIFRKSNKIINIRIKFIFRK